MPRANTCPGAPGQQQRSASGPSGSGRNDRSLMLMTWDAAFPVLLVGATAPIAGTRNFRHHDAGEAIGMLHPLVLLLALAAPILIGAAGGYESARDRTIGPPGLFARLVFVAATLTWVLWLLAAVGGTAADLGQLAIVFLILPLAWMAPRLVGALRIGRRAERVLLIGSGHTACRIAEVASLQQEGRVTVVGCVDDRPAEATPYQPRVLGGLDDLARLVTAESVDRVIVCFSLVSDKEMRRVVVDAEALGVDVDIVPRMFDLFPPSRRDDSVGELPLIRLRHRSPNALERAVKRTVDVAGSLLLLTVLSLPLLMIVIAIRLDDGGPVLYRSARVGRGGRAFRMLKYRTMAVGTDRDEAVRVRALVAGHHKPERAPGVTRVGAFLRSLSLDELPQLVNVLRGDMSLVGPRPILVSETHGVAPWQTARNWVRPGMTGLWQVAGRGRLRWDERMHLDLSYSRHWSLATDLKILVKTVPALFSRIGAS